MGKSKIDLGTEAPVVITGNTTVLELVAAGVIKITQLETWNRRLEKGVEKQQDDLTQTRANQAIAFYLGSEYPFAPVSSNEELHSRRSERVGGKRFAFGLKATEKALLKFGISRRMIEKAFSQMRDEGVMMSTKGICANNAHTRHAIIKAS